MGERTKKEGGDRPNENSHPGSLAHGSNGKDLMTRFVMRSGPLLLSLSGRVDMCTDKRFHPLHLGGVVESSAGVIGLRVDGRGKKWEDLTGGVLSLLPTTRS